MLLLYAAEEGQSALQRVWLKAVAPLNMLLMVVTFATFHAEMSWLKAVAPWNISPISVTAATFHLEMSLLKEVAPLNM
jgi:hypothetical protein